MIVSNNANISVFFHGDEGAADVAHISGALPKSSGICKPGSTASLIFIFILRPPEDASVSRYLSGRVQMLQ